MAEVKELKKKSQESEGEESIDYTTEKGCIACVAMIIVMGIGFLIAPVNPLLTMFTLVASPAIAVLVAVCCQPSMSALVPENPFSEEFPATSQPPSRSPVGKKGVSVLRGGEFVGNRMRFKVKVMNDSILTITDVTVWLLSYPTEALHLEGDDDDVKFSKIEPSGFRSPHFDLLPTQDCVRGNIVAGVSYVDAEGRPHTVTTEPYVIRAVCDLLQPEMITSEDFQLRLQDLHHGELTVKVEDWTPREMHDKTLRILDDANFHEISSDIEEVEGIVQGEIAGWARGKYTGKKLGVRVMISGKARSKGASCRIVMSGEDEAMILPAIDDLKDRLSAWLCPFCGSKLTMDNVKSLQKGISIACPFCKVTIGR